MFETISTVIPVFYRNSDSGDQLRRALASVELQEFSPSQVILSDDSSVIDQPKVLEIITAFKSLPITYVNNLGKKGISGNSNNGILLSTSNYIHILHQDDFLAHETVYRDTIETLGKGNSGWAVLPFSSNGKVITPTWRLEALVGLNEIGGPSGVIAKKNHVFEFDEELELFNDVDLFFRLAKVYGEPSVNSSASICYGYGDYQVQRNTSPAKSSEEYRYLFLKYGKWYLLSLLRLLLRSKHFDLKLFACKVLIDSHKINRLLVPIYALLWIVSRLHGRRSKIRIGT